MIAEQKFAAAVPILAGLLASGRFTRSEGGDLIAVRTDLGPTFRDLKGEHGQSLMVRRDPAAAVLLALDLIDELSATIQAAAPAENKLFARLRKCAPGALPGIFKHKIK